MVCRIFCCIPAAEGGEDFRFLDGRGRPSPRDFRLVGGVFHMSRNLACPRDCGGCIMAINRHV